MRVIKRGGDHLLSLIEGTLDMARIEGGKLTLEPAPMRLRESLQQIARMFELQAQSKGIGFVAEIDAQSPELVRADEKRLRQILINLLGNAVKFTREGQVCFRLRYAREIAHFEIEDTGSGIQNADLGRVFEPYFSKKPLADSSGSGLGLAIVHGVVKEHDGFIDVTSVLGSGTAFMLYFPRAAGEPATPTPRREPPTRAARILMVDDDAIQLRTGQRVLGRLGYEITSVKSAPWRNKPSCCRSKWRCGSSRAAAGSGAPATGVGPRTSADASASWRKSQSL